MAQRDCTEDAEQLFRRFAEKNDLTFEVDSGQPMEVCWNFPLQKKLHLPVTLGLQNSDELNFGVSDFWSYFFPFDQVAGKFSAAIDAWVTGEARIAITGFRSRLLQVRKDEEWQTIYGANGCLFPFRFTPFRYVYNDEKSAEREAVRNGRQT